MVENENYVRTVYINSLFNVDVDGSSYLVFTFSRQCNECDK